VSYLLGSGFDCLKFFIHFYHVYDLLSMDGQSEDKI